MLGWGLLSTTNVEEKFTNYNYFIKIINEYSPQYLADFTPNTYSYSFSNNSIVYIGLHRQWLYIESFLLSTVQLYSNLSTDIRNIPSVSIFKTIMKNTSVTMNGLILARRNVILFHCQLRNMQINLTLIFFVPSFVWFWKIWQILYTNENANHYFLKSPVYNTNREKLLITLKFIN